MLALSLAVAVITAAPPKLGGKEGVPVVSVLYFDNLSKDPELEFMRKGFAELLITDLVAWDGVRVLERARLEDVLKELNFQQTKYVDKSTATKLGSLLGADYLIYGTLLPGGTRLNVEARLVKSGTGEVLFTVRETDDRDKIFDIEQRLANQIVAKIDAGLTANAQTRRKARVPDLATLIAYSKVLDLSDQGKLEDAQVALRALVSKAPTFLLGRERQTELLKQLEEYQKRKKDLLTNEVIALGKRVDEVLKDEGKYDAMPLAEKQHFLMIRVLKGRFLARVLKQHLSKHATGIKLPLEQDEAKAVVAMRNWVENFRKLRSEFERGERQHATVFNGVTTLADMDEGKLTEEETSLVQDGVIGEAPKGHEMWFDELVEFALLGEANDGEGYRFGPVLGAVDPKEDKAIRDELDAEIKKAISRHLAKASGSEWDISRLINLKAKVALKASNFDAAVTVYQQYLDVFPAGHQADDFEKKIKNLLEGGGNEFYREQQWQKAIVECSDDLNGGSESYERRLYRTGIRGLDQIWGEIEKCKVTRENRIGVSYALKHLAELSAEQDDCKRAEKYWGKFYEFGGGLASEIETSRKAFTPWCDFSTLQKSLTWFHLDGQLQGEFPRRPVSIMSYDDKVLTISANTDGPRYPGGSEEYFDLRLERQPNGQLKCVQARWRHRDGNYYEGTCNVKLTKTSPTNDGPGSDEGTCEVEFPKFPIGDTLQKQSAHCSFRVRRE